MWFLTVLTSMHSRPAISFQQMPLSSRSTICRSQAGSWAEPTWSLGVRPKESIRLSSLDTQRHSELGRSRQAACVRRRK